MRMSGSAISAAARDSDPDSSAETLSPATKSGDIAKAIHTVADWQLTIAKGKFNQDWIYGPLYLGLIAASEATGDHSYHDLVLAQADAFRWRLSATRNLHADDEAIAQDYETLYLERQDPIRIEDARATFNRLVRYTDNSDKDLWWWCDALFMAPAGRQDVRDHRRPQVHRCDGPRVVIDAAASL